MYPAHSRVGIGNLVLRHSIPNLSGRSQRRTLPGHQSEEMEIHI